MKPKRKSNWFWPTVCIFALLLLAATSLPLFSTVARRSPAIVQLSRLKQLATALKFYAEEHDGKFPTHLSELPSDMAPADVRQFHDPRTQQASDWLYYPGHTLDDPPGTILAASPITVSKRKRLVATLDTSSRIIDESEFQKLNAASRQK